MESASGGLRVSRAGKAQKAHPEERTSLVMVQAPQPEGDPCAHSLAQSRRGYFVAASFQASSIMPVNREATFRAL